jgi:hypothetical protein
VQVIYLWLSAFSTVCEFREWGSRLTLLLRDVVADASMVVAILYWALLFSGDTNLTLIHLHGVNAVIMLLDLARCATPVPMASLLYTWCYIIGYLTFDYAYVALGGTNQYGEHYVYGVLRFSSKADVIKAVILMAGVVLVACPLVHAFNYVWSRAVPAMLGRCLRPRVMHMQSGGSFSYYSASEDGARSPRSLSVIVF